MPGNLVDCFFDLTNNVFGIHNTIPSSFLELHHKNYISKTTSIKKDLSLLPPSPILIIMDFLPEDKKMQQNPYVGDLPRNAFVSEL
jgi:hypothetical protein